MPPMMRRRSVLLGIAASPAIPYSSRAQTSAPPSTVFTVALAELTKGRELKSGRIRLETSPLAESGSSVECKITVENALATPDQVRTIHLLSEQNPIATIARFHIAPDTGDVLIETSIRLRTTQHVHAIAQMADGALYADKSESVVLLAACLDAG
ncbi:MAG: hypothetical protein CTY20_09455 [Hyphomicrobium sp.]|nr:MAG: hypothetical protein CTY20_09455 [Hyphomicrobium sp.]